MYLIDVKCNPLVFDASCRFPFHDGTGERIMWHAKCNGMERNEV